MLKYLLSLQDSKRHVAQQGKSSGQQAKSIKILNIRCFFWSGGSACFLRRKEKSIKMYKNMRNEPNLG
jgi:hypothetical protein